MLLLYAREMEGLGGRSVGATLAVRSRQVLLAGSLLVGYLSCHDGMSCGHTLPPPLASSSSPLSIVRPRNRAIGGAVRLTGARAAGPLRRVFHRSGGSPYPALMFNKLTNIFTCQWSRCRSLQVVFR